ncbi:MAG TPA: hypothetical protein VGA21_13885 [Cyclobacteriaceae bacterium]|jgi:hypothetical protein
MKKLIERIFDKLPGTNNDLTYFQKVWVIAIAFAFSLIILIKAITHIINNF